MAITLNELKELLRGIKISKEDKWRSQNKGVNEDYDMMRITIDAPIMTWRRIKKIILNL